MNIQKRKSKTVKRSGRGSVAIIAILLMTSAILRLASGTSVAFAQGADSTKAVSEERAHGPLVGATITAGDRSKMSALLVALQAREEKVKAREVQMEMRSKALSVIDEEITKRLTALEQAEVELRGTLALANNAAENDLARLTSVYENMKPKDAAALFGAMEPDFAAGFLGRMRPDAAAAVLAGLSPDAAYSISVILASRNANAPKS